MSSGFSERRFMTSALIPFFSKSSAEEDVILLKKFYSTFRMFSEAGNMTVMEAYRAETPRDRINGLDLAQTFYQREPKSAFWVQACKEQMKLFEYQVREGKEPGKGVIIDMSISNLIEYYTMEGNNRRIAQLVSDFGVPDRRVWAVQVRAYASSNQWESLFKLAQSKKYSPIGYEPFVEACVEKGNSAEAVKYIVRMSDPGDKIVWFAKIG